MTLNINSAGLQGANSSLQQLQQQRPIRRAQSASPEIIPEHVDTPATQVSISRPNKPHASNPTTQNISQQASARQRINTAQAQALLAKFNDIKTVAEQVGFVDLNDHHIENAMRRGESLLADYRA